jgi:hypothetical protein
MSPTVNITAATNDGELKSRSVSNYTNARNGDEMTYSTSADSMTVGQSYTGAWFVWRSFLKFDTSSLPTGSKVTKVNLKLTAKVDESDADFDVEIIKADWSDYDPIDNDNRDAHFDLLLSATADADWRNTSGMGLFTTYTSADLDVTHINLDGYTYYGLRSSEDSDNSEPTGDEYIEIYTADYGTAAERPILVIEYSVADLMMWFI